MSLLLSQLGGGGPQNYELTKSDTQAVADAAALALARPDVADSATPSEAAALGVGMPVSDTLSAPTDAAVLGIGLGPAETQAATEALKLDATKALSDSAATAEASALSLTRPDVADAVTPSDATALGVGQAPSETATPADTLALAVAQALADGVTATEAIALNASLVANDTATATEAVSLALAMAFADSVTASESADIQLSPGGTEHTREPSDSVAPTDVLTLDAQTAMSETPVASEALVLALSTSVTDSVTVTEQIELLLFTSRLLDDVAVATDQIDVVLTPGVPEQRVVGQDDTWTDAEYFEARAKRVSHLYKRPEPEAPAPQTVAAPDHSAPGSPPFSSSVVAGGLGAAPSERDALRETQQAIKDSALAGLASGVQIAEKAKADAAEKLRERNAKMIAMIVASMLADDDD
jgi:hypothetical protein